MNYYDNDYDLIVKIKGSSHDNKLPPISLIELEDVCKKFVKKVLGKVYQENSYAGYEIVSERHFEKTHKIEVFGTGEYFQKISDNQFKSYSDYTKEIDKVYVSEIVNGDEWIEFHDIKAKIKENKFEEEPKTIDNDDSENELMKNLKTLMNSVQY